MVFESGGRRHIGSNTQTSSSNEICESLCLLAFLHSWLLCDHSRVHGNQSPLLLIWFEVTKLRKGWESTLMENTFPLISRRIAFISAYKARESPVRPFSRRSITTVVDMRRGEVFCRFATPRVTAYM